MPLNSRSISVSIAVASLFMISFIGWFAGLAPLTCCKRAVVAAIAAYMVSSIVVNIINEILISALVKSRLGEQKDQTSGSQG